VRLSELELRLKMAELVEECVSLTLLFFTVAVKSILTMNKQSAAHPIVQRPPRFALPYRRAAVTVAVTVCHGPPAGQGSLPVTLVWQIS
jgi:hypothetical protein